MIWVFLLAHVLTDFVFQTKTMATNKLELKNTIKHSVCLFIVTLLVVILAGFWDARVIFPILIVAVSHGMIDYAKANLEKKSKEKWSWLFFTCDQLLHVIFIFMAIFLFYPELQSGYVVFMEKRLFTNHIWKSLFFIFLITCGGSYFTASVCRAFNPQKDSNNSLESAGRYIGILERLIVFASILIGRYEVIGFLIAAKSIIRHPEKNDKSFAEYFLIGTFSSFVWAGAFTFLYLKIV
ncbi:MAG TPA: DUF3307 domain-containing protein [Candidatus Cloacimonadota bacterium]|nr:DUF3307 domain-containing protein [Candidatus Cloacimonadota bacterium]